MTVASINSTITVVVEAEFGTVQSSRYEGTVAKVSEALEAREYDIVDAIVEAANSQYGVSRHEAATLLHNAGLAERPKPVAVPEPVFEDEAVTADEVAAGKKSKAERIAKLEEDQAQILSTLSELAGHVRTLSELANRHLGSSL